MSVKIVTVSGFKGGTAKSTTAIHLARFLQAYGKTLLVDGDPNRSCVSWASRGDDLGFAVLPDKTAMTAIGKQQYVVIDMPARPDSSDLKEIADGCDLVIMPSPPSSISIEPTLETVKVLGDNAYMLLVTIIPPYPNKSGEKTHKALIDAGLSVAQTTIRYSVQFQTAALKGQTVDMFRGTAREPWEDYENLGKEILEVLNR